MGMMPFLAMFAGFSTIICGLVYVAIRFKHLDRRMRGSAELEDVAQRLVELEEHSEQRLAELEERLDFAERMLTEQRARHRIQAPREG